MYWIYFLVVTGFSYWVIFMDGAEVLDGWLAAIVLEPIAAAFTPVYLRFYVGIIWVLVLGSLVRNVFLS